MKIKWSRKLIGVASAMAIVLFISNPEIFALSFVLSSIGLDVFLLFLTFQLKDQFNYLYSLTSFFRKKFTSQQKITLMAPIYKVKSDMTMSSDESTP